MSFWDNKQDTLCGMKLQEHGPRMARSAAASAPVTMFNFALVLTAASSLGINVILANLIAAPLTAPLTFWSNRRWAFSDRHTDTKAGLRKSVISRSTSEALNQGSFAVLVGVFGLWFLLAKAGLMLINAPIQYAVINGWIFHDSSFRRS